MNIKDLFKSKNNSDYKFKYFKFRGKTRTILFEHTRQYGELYFDLSFGFDFWNAHISLSFMFWGFNLFYYDEEVL